MSFSTVSYPRLSFRRVDHPDHEKSRYEVYGPDEELLGEVYSLHTGGWYISVALGGHSTRYEAAFSLYTAQGATNA